MENFVTWSKLVYIILIVETVPIISSEFDMLKNNYHFTIYILSCEIWKKERNFTEINKMFFYTNIIDSQKKTFFVHKYNAIEITTSSPKIMEKQNIISKSENLPVQNSLVNN
jgi:hypothetical protein